MIWRIIILLAASYVVLGMLLYLLQSRFVYYPTSQIVGTPNEIGLSYEDVTFSTKDGVKMSGWFVPANDDGASVVLFFHGNGGNISSRGEMLQLLNMAGASTFIVDYRGYGKSEGSPSEQGTYLDAEAAWRYLTEDRKIAPDQIVIYGRSLGGAIAANLAKDVSPRGLVLDSAFISAADMAADHYWIFPVRLMIRFKYDTLEYLGRVKCPVLFIHSRDDDLVPFKHGQQLYDSAGEPKDFIELEGGHNDSRGSQWRQIEPPLKKFLSGSAKD